MAKRKPAAPQPATPAVPESLRPVRLELSQESHDALRVLAAKRQMPMSVYVRELVEEKIRKENQE